MNHPDMPVAARLIGAAGLLPSLAMLLLLAAGARGFALSFGPAYGALIASFIGGAWWGLAVLRSSGEALPGWLAVAVLPTLLAWVALMLPPATALLLLGLIFALLPLADRQAHQSTMTVSWWMSLRMPLSAAMAVIHTLSALILIARG